MIFWILILSLSLIPSLGRSQGSELAQHCINVKKAEHFPFTYSLMPRLFRDGKLTQITEALPKVKALGFEQILIGPIQSQTTYDDPKDGINNHGYWPARHDDVDLKLGTESDLRDLVKTAHKLGLKILLDFPLDHFGRFGKEKAPAFLKKPINDPSTDTKLYAHLDESTSFKNTLEIQKQISQRPLFGLPSIDLDSPEGASYIFSSAKKYISMGFDGFRIDAAKHVSFSFLKKFANDLETIAHRRLQFYFEITTTNRPLSFLALDLLSSEAGADFYFQDFPMQMATRMTVVSGYKFDEVKKLAEERKQCPTLYTHFVSAPENHDGGVPIKNPFHRKLIFGLTSFLSFNSPIIHHGMESKNQSSYTNRQKIERIETQSPLMDFLKPYLNFQSKRKSMWKNMSVVNSSASQVVTITDDLNDNLKINFKSQSVTLHPN